MKNPEPIHFPATYQEARQELRVQLDTVKKSWPSAVLERKLISEEEDLSMDWIRADALSSRERLLILSAGLHGVEGFVGAAMQSLFIREFLAELDPASTGLLLIHAINPWGMFHRRRVNQENVDLNRNFMVDAGDFGREFNPAYRKLNHSFNPGRPLLPYWLEGPGFYLRVVLDLLRHGIKDLRGAVLLGQQSNPQGLYYAGEDYQLETQTLMDLVQGGLSGYREVLLIDLHTGYGPRYQMSLVNSPAEERKPAELMQAFRYPSVLQADPEQFYTMQGDMVDWVYRLQRSDFPEVRFFGTAFEFGTMGDSVLDEITSLRILIYENQAHWQGTDLPATKTRIEGELLEMFFPSEERWREKAVQDCRQALAGILEAEGFLCPGIGQKKLKC